MVTVPRHPVRRVSVSQSLSGSVSILKPEGVYVVCSWFFSVAFAKYGVPLFVASVWAFVSRAFALWFWYVSLRILIMSWGLFVGFWLVCSSSMSSSWDASSWFSFS